MSRIGENEYFKYAKASGKSGKTLDPLLRSIKRVMKVTLPTCPRIMAYRGKKLGNGGVDTDESARLRVRGDVDCSLLRTFLRHLHPVTKVTISIDMNNWLHFSGRRLGTAR